MTTITIKNGLKKLRQHSYNDYKELMEELAELHDYKIIWQVSDDQIPKTVLDALEEHLSISEPKLFNL